MYQKDQANINFFKDSIAIFMLRDYVIWILHKSHMFQHCFTKSN